nr:unnamed protein product [Callosobruchus analis]
MFCQHQCTSHVQCTGKVYKCRCAMARFYTSQQNLEKV